VDVRLEGEKGMHVHGNQFDPNIQMYSLSAAARAEAKKGAERTRNKLLNASALGGEYDDSADCVVSLSRDGGEQGNQRNQHDQGGHKQQDGQGSSEGVDNPFSDWA
jgi:hypothetical protein